MARAPMARDRRGYPMKAAPDQRDGEIFAMLAERLALAAIAKRLGIQPESVTGRIRWCKAERWATHADQLLSADDRDCLLKVEQQLFPKESAA